MGTQPNYMDRCRCFSTKRHALSSFWWPLGSFSLLSKGNSTREVLHYWVMNTSKLVNNKIAAFPLLEWEQNIKHQFKKESNNYNLVFFLLCLQLWKTFKSALLSTFMITCIKSAILKMYINTGSAASSLKSKHRIFFCTLILNVIKADLLPIYCS